MKKNISIIIFSILFLVIKSQTALAQTIEQLVKQGEQAHNTGRYSQAENIWRRILQSQSGNAEIYVKLGITLSIQNRFDEAIAAFRKAIEIAPHYADAYTRLDIVLSDQNKLNEPNIKIDPKYTAAAAYSYLGIALSDQNKLDEAIKEKPLLKKSKLTPINEIQTNLSSYFADIPDPRVSRTKKHLLKDILVIAILAIIAGAQGWEDIENYGLAKQEWLEESLELPHGIPSDDTFRRLFERINPEALENSLAKWVQQLIPSLEQEIVPIDGKCLRGSYDRNQGVKTLHLVTAWAAQQRLVLGQIKVEDHSNEITAIPALLELIDIKGTIVTIDAMGTQTEIVRLIHEKKADYVLALKSNHPTLHSQVKDWFDVAIANNFGGITVSKDRRLEKGHHRTEKRIIWAVPLSEFGGLYQQEQWLGLQSIVIVERTRHLWNKVTHEIQFYLSSLAADAQVLGNAIRTHWGIENQVHWTLDVTFNEDKSRIRSCHAPRNFALLRRMALNALNLEKNLRRSLRQKSKRASMNNDYMMTVLQSFCQG